MNESQQLPENGTYISLPITAANAALCDEILRLHRNAIVGSNTSIDRPHFDAATGELTFRGEVIREYAKKAKNCFVVLNAFQKLDWPRCIHDPLSIHKKAERLNNTVRSLNRHLRDIHFHAAGDAMSIRWKPQH